MDRQKLQGAFKGWLLRVAMAMAVMVVFVLAERSWQMPSADRIVGTVVLTLGTALLLSLLEYGYGVYFIPWRKRRIVLSSAMQRLTALGIRASEPSAELLSGVYRGYRVEIMPEVNMYTEYLRVRVCIERPGSTRAVKSFVLYRSGAVWLAEGRISIVLGVLPRLRRVQKVVDGVIDELERRGIIPAIQR